MNQPQAPDPYATAAAQTASNKDTATYQQSLNQTNQITPYGSVNYAQTGTAADGAPITTATTTLSPQVQGLVDSNISNAQGISNLGGELQQSVGGAIAAGTPSAPTLTNLDLSNNATQAKLDAMNRATLDPQWATLQNQNDQTTYDRGLAPGSEGWAQSQRDFGTARNQAYDQMYVADQGQAATQLAQENQSANANAQAGFQNQLTATQAPINELSALQTGSQISQPGVGQTANSPQTSVAGTNISGLIEQNYQNQLASSNAAMGGLFGLGGAALGAAGNVFKLSDRRLKTDVTRIGARADGLPIYAWRYVWGGPLQSGPMAQDVRALYPDAVFEVGGFLAIDLGRLP